MMYHYQEHGNNSEHSLKSLNKNIKREQLEDFLADEDNKQDIVKRVETMSDPEKDFHRDSEITPMPKSYRHKENELVQTKCYGITEPSIEKMDIFSRSKPKENIADSEEIKATIEKLKALGIRDANYAKVKLGLMGYEEYLEGRPELLRYRRFKSILKKAIGYSGVYSGTPGVSRIMTIESLFYKAYGDNNVWNTWFDEVNEPKYTGLNCQTSVREYLDTAVEFVLAYIVEKYKDVIAATGVLTKDEILLTGIILGMLDYGYNAKQILFAVIRPTEAKRNWKMQPISDYYKFNTAPDFYNEMCVRIIKSLDELGRTKHATGISELRVLVNQPSETLLGLTYESLMITNIDEVKQLMRKNRIISTVYSTSNRLRYDGDLEDNIKQRFDKYVKIFVKYFADYFIGQHENDGEDILDALNSNDYETLAEAIDKLIEESGADKSHIHEIARNANKAMPDIRRRQEKFDNEGAPNYGEIAQICYNFQWGTPQY